MQPSSLTSSSKLFRKRNLWIVLIALCLSVGFYAALWFSDQNDAPETAVAVQAELAEDEMIGIQPASFQQISEFTDTGVQKLRLSGGGEAGAVVVLTNRGERLRQIPVNDLGQWGVTLNVEEAPMVLEAQLYQNETSVPIRSEETVFRLPVPAGDEAADGVYKADALILVTSPGTPSRLIQSPFGDVPTSGPLSLSLIDYDYAGGVIITGTSSLPGRIRIYAQGAVIGDIAIGVSGRWSYIAGRMLPRGGVDIRVELIAAPGILNAPEETVSLTVPYNFLPPLREEQTDGSGSLSVNRDPLQWQVRRTLIGGGGQSTVIFSPEIIKPEEIITPEGPDP